MAKKRRRRRVDGGKSAAKILPKPAAPEPEVDVDGEDEDDEDEGGVVMPPMPSELGVDAVMTAQVRRVLISASSSYLSIVEQLLGQVFSFFLRSYAGFVLAVPAFPCERQ